MSFELGQNPLDSNWETAMEKTFDTNPKTGVSQLNVLSTNTLSCSGTFTCGSLVVTSEQKTATDLTYNTSISGIASSSSSILAFTDNLNGISQPTFDFLQGTTSNIQTQINATDALNIVQTGRLDNIDILNTTQTGRLDNTDISINATEALNIMQTGRLDNIDISVNTSDALNIVQTGRLDIIDALNITQNNSLLSVQTQINTKAPLISPIFTGVATVPNALSTSNNLQIANTAFVKTQIADLINGSATT